MNPGDKKRMDKVEIVRVALAEVCDLCSCRDGGLRPGSIRSVRLDPEDRAGTRGDTARPGTSGRRPARPELPRHALRQTGRSLKTESLLAPIRRPHTLHRSGRSAHWADRFPGGIHRFRHAGLCTRWTDRLQPSGRQRERLSILLRKRLPQSRAYSSVRIWTFEHALNRRSHRRSI